MYLNPRVTLYLQDYVKIMLSFHYRPTLLFNSWIPHKLTFATKVHAALSTNWPIMVQHTWKPMAKNVLLVVHFAYYV